jgi:hypothetical protein
MATLYIPGPDAAVVAAAAMAEHDTAERERLLRLQNDLLHR